MAMLNGPIAARITLGACGALAGLGLWALVDLAPDYAANDRIILACATFLAAFFAPILAMTGPLSPGRAIFGALAIAAPLTALMTTASSRFDTVEAFIETGHPIVACFLCIALPTPFLVAGLGPQRRWIDYAVLFDAAWDITVRALAALLFLAAVWAALGMGELLLGLVGFEVFEFIFDIGPLPYLISGISLGLGAAVASELSEYVSPRLPLHLLRLILPVVLILTLVFIAALPFRGFSGLFGGLSIAVVLIAMAFAAATLVSTAIDRDDAHAARHKLMVWGALLLALAAPVLSALAVYSITERVSQYGWSPDRLAAMTAAVMMAGYGLTYAGSVLARREWMARIRQANTAMAIGVLLVAIAWLSPLFNPQRLAVSSQIGRYLDGQVPADAVDLWAIGREWGRPGAAALETFAAIEGDQAQAMAERLALLETSRSRREFEQAVPPLARQALTDALSAAIPVLPEGNALPPEIFADQSRQMLESFTAACGRATPAGRPGCIALRTELVPARSGPETLLFMMMTDGFVQIFAFAGSGAALGRFGPTWISADATDTHSPALIDRIAEGAFELGPVNLNAVRIGEAELIILP